MLRESSTIGGRKILKFLIEFFYLLTVHLEAEHEKLPLTTTFHLSKMISSDSTKSADVIG